MSSEVAPKRPYPRIGPRRPYRQFHQSRRHSVNLDDEQWEMGTKIAASMRPPSSVSAVMQWLLDEALKREYEAAVKAGAIVLEEEKKP